MRKECIEAVEQAIGRALKAGEAREIEARVLRNKKLAPTDLPDAERLQWAGEAAAKEIIGAAATHRKQVITATRADSSMLTQINDARPMGRSDVVLDYLTTNATGKTGMVSVEAMIEARQSQALGPLVKAINEISGDSLLNFVREVHGQKTGDSTAANLAALWKETTDELANSFRLAGGVLGKLEDWGMPHTHSARRVLEMGVDAWKQKLIDGGKLNRDKYLNLDGSRMDDAALGEFFDKAFDTIISDGLLKDSADQVKGRGTVAGRHAAHRSIHFKDGDAYIEYASELGDAPIRGAMVNHIKGLARDIVLMETSGPNAKRFYEKWAEYAAKEDIREAKALQNYDLVNEIQKKQDRINALASSIIGERQVILNETAYNVALGTRNLTTSALLGGVLLASQTDIATSFLTAAQTTGKGWPAIKKQLRLVADFRDKNPAHPFLNNLGLGYEQALGAMIRYGEQDFADTSTRSGRFADATGKAVDFVFKWQGMNHWHHAMEKGLAAHFMGTLGDAVARHEYGDLTAVDKKFLDGYGLGEKDFAIWKKAQLQDWRGNGSDKVLSPDAIKQISDADMAAAIPEVLQSIHDEAQAQIDQLNERNTQENGWIDKRKDSFIDAYNKAAQKAQDYAGKRGAKQQALADKLKDRAELLKAKLDAAQVRADIDAYLLAQKAQDQIIGYLRDVEDGKPVDRQPGQTTDSVGEKASRAVDKSLLKRGAMGEKLGKLEGDISRRIIDLEARIKADGIQAGKDLDAKTKSLIKDMEAKQAELDDFIQRSQDRQQKRQFVIDRIARDIGPQIKDTIKRERDNAATRLYGAILSEVHMGVVVPNARNRLLRNVLKNKGGFANIIWDSIMQFKLFPLASMSNHFARALAQDTRKGKGVYVAKYVGYTTFLGAMVLQLTALKNGQDPEDMTDPSFWPRAVMKGGGMGPFGDFLVSSMNKGGFDALEYLTGPMGGLANSMAGAYHQTVTGNIDKAGSAYVRAAKTLIPGQNLWYISAALNRLIFDEINEYFNPGFKAKFRNRMQKEFGTTFYASPIDSEPLRAPNFKKAIGQE